jgi:23S rRNA (guanine2445-N2)-methyltransferase
VFTYQKFGSYFAQVAEGLEELCRSELQSLGATETRAAYRGVHFRADRETLYRVNYLSRIASRVLAPLITFDCHSPRYLYRTAKSLDWGKLLGVEGTFAVFANVSDSKITHSKYAALCVKDAVADHFRERTGQRPDVDTREPDVWIGLHLRHNRAMISLDTSGGSLHRRGYRAQSVTAPIQETVAAAMICLSGWDGEKQLWDPMCGSGTILSEALMSYCRIPPAYLRRRFGFERLPDFDRRQWESVKDTARKAIRPLPPGLISGSDESDVAIEAARKNLSQLPGGSQVGLQRLRYQELEGLRNLVIISNPPFGIRLGAAADMAAFGKELGDFLKQRCAGSTAYFYFGDRSLIKTIGLRPSWKKPLSHGGLDGRLVKFESY